MRRNPECIGRLSFLLQAARAYDEAARQHFGVFGRLNFGDVGKADKGG